MRITVVVGHVLMCRNQTVLITYYTAVLRANAKLMLSAVEQTA